MTTTAQTPESTTEKAPKKPKAKRFAVTIEELTPEAEAAGEINPYRPQFTTIRRNGRLAGRGAYAPNLLGAPTSTKQARILNTAVIAPSTDTAGIVQGRDAISGAIAAGDPATHYMRKVISSPNVVILGDIGAGKSSNSKCTYVARPLTMRYRRAVVLDRKDRNGEGEYSELARAYGSEPLKFASDGTGTRLNLLDETIAGASGKKGVVRLLTTLAELANEGKQLTRWEARALSLAHDKVRRDMDESRTPVLTDVLRRLGNVADLDETQGWSELAIDRLHQSGLSVANSLHSLLEEYGDLFDGETTKDVDLGHKLTSFDISQLPHDGPAVPAILSIAHLWLLGRLRRERGWLTNCVYEEGWAMTTGPVAKLAKSHQKLSRGLGLSNVFVFHKMTDIPRGSDGFSMVQEAQTVHIYRQSQPSDADAVCQAFGLDPDLSENIQTLPTGYNILKVGGRAPALVQHVRSPWEIQMTDTDDAFKVA